MKDQHELGQFVICDPEPYFPNGERMGYSKGYSPPVCPACGSTHHTSYIRTVSLIDDSSVVSGDLSLKSVEICTCLNCGCVVPRTFTGDRDV